MIKRQSAIRSEQDNQSGTMLASRGNLVAIVGIPRRQGAR
jgi:hypothetical protein